MANFQQALQWLEEGKAIKRSKWDSYIIRSEVVSNFCSRIHLPYTTSDGKKMPAKLEHHDFMMYDMLADDWEETIRIKETAKGMWDDIISI